MLDTTNALSLLDTITDLTRLTARSLAGAVRATILMDPARLMCSAPDMSRWNTKRFQKDLDYIDLVSKSLKTNVVRDFTDGPGKDYAVPELHVIHRLEWELDLIRHVCNMLLRRTKPQVAVAYAQNMDRFPSTGLESPEDVLNTIFLRLNRFKIICVPVLQMWADSPVTDPDPSHDADGASDKRWSMFSECLPGFPAPGNIYPDLEKLAKQYAENPHLLELIRTDEAVYMILVLLLLLYDGIPHSNPVWQGYDITYASNSLVVCMGDAGWSGGDGLINSLNRMSTAVMNAFIAADRLMMIQGTSADWGVCAEICAAIYNGRSHN